MLPEIFAETERLILRELMPKDAEGLFELDSDPEVHRYVGNKPVTSLDECLQVVKLIRKQYVENGIGRWAVIDRSNNSFVGWAGLKLITETVNGHTNFYDLGYRFIRKHWGKGFATESGIAARNYAFDHLKAKEIFAMTDVDNHASRRVLEKVGLKYIETFNYNGLPGWIDEDEPCTWYGMENPNGK